MGENDEFRLYWDFHGAIRNLWNYNTIFINFHLRCT